MPEVVTASPRTLERFPETWEDVVAADAGHVFCDEWDDGMRFLIVRGPSSLCAYVGVSPSHPVSGWDYDNVPISAHGGLTYAGTNVHGDGETWWYGWDYSHSGDYSTYYDTSSFGERYRHDETKWTPAMVYDDSWEARWDFKALVRLAEQIARKGWKEPTS